MPTFTLVLILTFFTPPTHADYQTGLDAYNAGRYTTALENWIAVTNQPAAEVNPAIYAEAHYAIGMLYWMGLGVNTDYNSASTWLRKAAELGNSGAQGKMGYLYTEGITVQQSYETAFEWFSKAAKQGDIDSQYNLGLFYLNGWGTAQDKTMAAQYLAAASAQGDEDAEVALQALLPLVGSEAEESSAAMGGEIKASSDSVGAGLAGTELVEAGMAGTELIEAGMAGTELVEAGMAGTELVEAGMAGTELVEAGMAGTDLAGAGMAGTDLAGADSNETDSVGADPVEADTVGTITHPTQAPRGRRDPAAIPSNKESMFLPTTWILAQNPSHYTIQVIGLREKSDLENLVNSYHHYSPFATYTIQSKGRPLHLLVQGVYTNVESARKARDAFPKAIQKPKNVWIRQFVKIQELINAEVSDIE